MVLLISRGVIDRALRPFHEFARAGALGGIALLGTAIVALVWANSPWSPGYFHLWETRLTIGLATLSLTTTVHHVINDGLMAVFFLLVGLEIKRELLVGELASIRQAALPIAGAIGGMIVPALIYAALNATRAGAAGWGIPMATDIAFALGILALAGSRVPIGLKVFLTAFAILDDLCAVIVIALFYTASLSMPALAAAGVLTLVLVALNRARVESLVPYLIVGVLLWVALLSSGLHATIAGVILAFAIPARRRVNAAELLVLTSKGQQEAIHRLDLASDAVQGPLLRLEHALHATVAFVIVPLFALANAGVRIDNAAEMLSSSVTVGVVLGLVLGKPIGITAFSWLAIRFLGAAMPANVSFRQLHAVSWIGGIGFTMSLFISGLAFGASPLLDAAKVGILGASLAAGVAGYTLLRRSRPTLPL